MRLKREEPIHSEPVFKGPQALRESGAENPDCLQIVRATQAPRRSMTETFPTAKVRGSEREVIARKENFQKGEIWRCSFGSSPESHPRLCEPKRLHRGYKHPWDKG